MVKANTFEPRILPSEVLFQPCKPTGINTFWFRSPLNSDSCLHKLLYKASRRTNGNVRITPQTGSRAYQTRVVHHLLLSPVRAKIIGGVWVKPTGLANLTSAGSTYLLSGSAHVIQLLSQKSQNNNVILQCQLFAIRNLDELNKLQQ